MNRDLEEYRVSISTGVLVAFCRPELKLQARGLLEWFERNETPALAPSAGSRVLFGGAPLKLRERDGALVLTEPNYFSASPMDNWRDDVSLTLLTLASQASLIQATRAEPGECRWDMTLAVERGCLSKTRKYMQRSIPVSPNDSGWCVSSSEAEDLAIKNKPASAYESLPVYRLFQTAPVLLQALTLPTDYIAEFENDALENVLDSSDKTVWRRRKQ